MPKTRPTPVALTPALPDDAACPLRIHRIPEGIVAAYSEAQLDRPSAWQLLLDLFGDLFDVTPDFAAVTQ
ncbi:hypothetical protein ACIRVF_08145 [Kitasatospora sp. NPDC101157]|uniref:hypothetical protein n=1 Tax=Kitasatospora sp. NPDC101157 TaxID=3364098 RepID=UPI00382C09BC